MWNQHLESELREARMYASVKSDDVDVPDDWEDLEDLTDEEREPTMRPRTRPVNGKCGKRKPT
jgi:hypothetical protein